MKKVKKKKAKIVKMIYQKIITEEFIMKVVVKTMMIYLLIQTE